VNLDQSLARLAIRSAAAVEADFAGVDILLGSDERPYVLEVNSMPAWRGLQSVASVDIAAAVAADFLDRLREGILARRIG
ncbi:MAG: hypothetical protein JOZ88_13610, partial [Hyphomicrobiales bacterium]|nr:hypothetical protein [Hyphomicrobiales bacterium]